MIPTMLRGLLAAAILSFTVTATAQTKWDMPTPYPDSNFHTKNDQWFADQVKQATGGKLDIVIHSNGSLIKMPEITRAVQSGQVNIGEILMSVLSNSDPIFGVDSIPFLAPNYKEARRLWNIARPYVAKRLDERGITLLYSVAWQPQGIYTKKPITSTADLRGTKFRTYSPTTSEFAKLIGAVPTTVQAPDVPQAFLTGLVDAMITSSATGVDTQAWDYLKHYYNVQAFLPLDIIMVNKNAFDALDAKTRNAIKEIAAKAEEKGWATSSAENDGLLKTMSQHGIHVEAPNPKLKQQLDAIGKKMAESWAKKAGADGAAILAAFRK